MNQETISPIPDVQILVAIGALTAIEAVLRRRIDDEMYFGCGTTVEVPLVTLIAWQEFAEACRKQLEPHLPPEGGKFSAAVATVVESFDAPERPRTQVTMLAATSSQASVDSAKPVLAWFVCELGRIMACGMPHPHGTFGIASRLAFFFKYNGSVDWLEKSRATAVRPSPRCDGSDQSND